VRDGDRLSELPGVLTVRAAIELRRGDLDRADEYLDEALAITVPRRLVPAQAEALAARAAVAASRHETTRDRNALFLGRDAADAALRISVDLPWHELDALDAHARLDRAEGVDRGFGQRANDLRARLIPRGLDPDPLATAERIHQENQQAATPGSPEPSTEHQWPHYSG
jgi:hypothetical protein